jgi:thioester reductase-like protein
MEYFVTGASGFIGRRLVKKLLSRRGAVVHFLIRQSSQDKVAELLAYWGVDEKRAKPVFGDLVQPRLGLTKAALKQLGGIDHFFHLAAVYDLGADARCRSTSKARATRWSPPTR